MAKEKVYAKVFYYALVGEFDADSNDGIWEAVRQIKLPDGHIIDSWTRHRYICERMLAAQWRSIPRTYTVWRMNDLAIAGKECYNCTVCGMAMEKPCEHWLASLTDRKGEQDG